MGIGLPELMIILVIIMIIFGAGKLPEIGSAFGNSIKNFKKSMKEAGEVDSGETDSDKEVLAAETPALAESSVENSETPVESPEEAPTETREK